MVGKLLPEIFSMNTANRRLRPRRKKVEVLRDQRSLYSVESLKERIDKLSSNSILEIRFDYGCYYEVIRSSRVGHFFPMLAEYDLLFDFYTTSIIRSSEHKAMSLDFVLIFKNVDILILSKRLCVLHQ